MSDTRRASRSLIVAACALFASAILYLAIVAADPRELDLLFGAWRFRHVALALGLLFSAAAVLATWLGRNAAMVFWSSALTAGILVVALEGAGRLGLIDWRAFPGQASASARGPGWSLTPDVSVQGETHQDIATRFGIAHDAIPFDFQTDGYGFRNDPGTEANIGADSGADSGADTGADTGVDTGADIILLGDSIVLGAQVPKALTLDSIVEQALGKPVMQAALLGLSIQAQHEMLSGTGIPLNGKHVVQFLFEGNDLIDSRDYRMQRDEGRATGDAGTSSFLKLLWDPLVRRTNPPARYHGCEIEGRMHLFLWTRRSFDGVTDEFSAITEAIAAFRDRVEAAGGTYALVFVPTKYRVLHAQCTFPAGSLISTPDQHLSPLRDLTAEWAAKAGIPYLDLTAALQDAAATGTSPWLWGDTHWNATGHAIAGSAVAEWIGGQ